MEKNNLVQNTALLVGSTAIIKGLNLIMIPLFSAWISTEDYGIFDLLSTYIALLVPFISLSSSEAIFRFSVVDKQNISKYVSTSFEICIINIFIVLVSINLFKGWKFVLPFTMLLISELFSDHLQGIVRAKKKLNIYAVSNVLSTIFIAISVTIFVRIMGLDLSGMIYGYALGYFIGDFFIVISVRYWKILNLKHANVNTFKSIVKYSLPLTTNNICWWIIDASDRSLISLFLNASANGIYAIACKIPNMCASICNVFILSWQEAAIDALSSDERNFYYNSIFNKTLSMMISLCGGILSLNFIFFHYLFDYRYYEAHLYVPILVTSIIFSTITQFMGGINISFKRTTENGITTIIGAITNIIIDLIWISKIGILAAALSTIISNIVMTLLRMFKLRKEVKFRVSKINSVLSIYYIYAFICSYFIDEIIISLVNMFLAVSIFSFMNREVIKKFLDKILKRLH